MGRAELQEKDRALVKGSNGHWPQTFTGGLREGHSCRKYRALVKDSNGHCPQTFKGGCGESRVAGKRGQWSKIVMGTAPKHLQGLWEGQSSRKDRALVKGSNGHCPQTFTGVVGRAELQER